MLPSEGFIPVGEEDSIICDALKKQKEKDFYIHFLQYKNCVI